MQKIWVRYWNAYHFFRSSGCHETHDGRGVAIGMCQFYTCATDDSRARDPRKRLENGFHVCETLPHSVGRSQPGVRAHICIHKALPLHITVVMGRVKLWFVHLNTHIATAIILECYLAESPALGSQSLGSLLLLLHSS